MSLRTQQLCHVQRVNEEFDADPLPCDIQADWLVTTLPAGWPASASSVADYPRYALCETCLTRWAKAGTVLRVDWL